MTLEQKLLVDAVKASVTGKPATLDGEPNWQILLKLAEAHRVEALCYDGLKKSNIPLPEAVQRTLSVSHMQAIYSGTQMEFLKEQLQPALEAAGIEHIFLKGAVLKYDYPEPALRTMCDMDILIHPEDFANIDAVAKGLGASAHPGDGNHKNYTFYNSITVEFHPNLLHHATPVAADINPGWQYAKENTPSYAKELTEEGFYLNTVCHLANHFVGSGIGLRFALDVWVNRHLRNKPINRAFVEAELTRFGLLDFVRNVEDLTDAWFGELPMTPVLEELGNYILTSGSHGTVNRAMLNALSLSSGGNRFSALLKRAFYPRAELEDRFPWCKGKPILLPAAWCCRAYKAVTTHGDLVAQWSRDTGKFSKEEITAQREKLGRFGIRTPKS